MSTMCEREAQKRKPQRACDVCHKRKIRCYSVTDDRCSSCISLNVKCTRTEPTRKRGPKSRRDVELEELRDEVSTLKAQLRQVHPSLVPPVIDQHSGPPTPPSDISTPELSHLEDDDSDVNALAERFKTDLAKDKFWGDQSDFILLKNAIATQRHEDIGPEPERKRPEFWNMRPWEEEATATTPEYVFPDSDLMTSLVELYFTNIHAVLPLLHRPTFERSVGNGLHLRNHQFGATLLAVLALGSRYSDDPRVLAPGATSTLSSGWIFFDQVQVIKKSLHDQPSLYSVQLYCLIALFLHGTSSPQASWIYMTLGIRFLEERGEHRRRREGRKLTVEGELWNRAFWCLLSLDTTMCACLGRSSAIHIEDYDLDPPLEVDDEYFEHPDPEQAFKQPPGKISTLAYFAHHIRLCEILGSALRLLYASDRSKKLMGWVGVEWEQRAVADLDSAMNEFLGAIPDHLRWNPDRTGVFFDQSVLLYTMFYQLQITIHRPHIHTSTALAFPSLAICTRAARSTINVVDLWLNKFQRVALASLQSALFISSIVLLLNVFGAKRVRLTIDVEKELAHVKTAMRVLKYFETRNQTAGRAWELLQDLCSRSGGPDLAQQEPPVENSAVADAVVAAEGTSANNTRGVGGLSTDLIDPQHQQSAIDVDLWNEIFLSNSMASTTPVPQACMSMEQMLAATAGYDSSVVSGTHWAAPTVALADASNGFNANTNLPPNLPPMDDEVMSMWMAAPTGFGDLDQWDSYIGMGNAGFTWPNCDPRDPCSSF
ncbi:fungal-specific transcription factor domain-containing protein [Mycena crocata]|nr:fungal-specific transcription factor domain-containing protein [Mycena crocata]